jgi:hypothetical protein
MLNPHLQRRFDQLLAHSLNPKFQAIARERIAAANELVDTVLALDLITPEQWRKYRDMTAEAVELIAPNELQRVIDATRS